MRRIRSSVRSSAELPGNFHDKFIDWKSRFWSPLRSECERHHRCLSIPSSAPVSGLESQKLPFLVVRAVEMGNSPVGIPKAGGAPDDVSIATVPI